MRRMPEWDVECITRNQGFGDDSAVTNMAAPPEEEHGDSAICNSILGNSDTLF